MFAGLSFVTASVLFSSLLLVSNAAPASLPAADLHRRQGALTTADGLVGSVFNLTTTLRRDTVDAPPVPRQLSEVTGLLASLIGGSSAAPAGAAAPASPVSGLLPRQGILTDLDTAFGGITTLAGAVRRREDVEVVINNDGQVKVDVDGVPAPGSTEDGSTGDNGDTDEDEDEDDPEDEEEPDEDEADEDEEDEDEEEEEEEDEDCDSDSDDGGSDSDSDDDQAGDDVSSGSGHNSDDKAGDDVSSGSGSAPHGDDQAGDDINPALNPDDQAGDNVDSKKSA